MVIIYSMFLKTDTPSMDLDDFFADPDFKLERVNSLSGSDDLRVFYVYTVQVLNEKLIS